MIPYKAFEVQVAKELSAYPLLNWRTKKVANLCKLLHKKGMSVKEVTGFILLQLR